MDMVVAAALMLLAAAPFSLDLTGCEAVGISQSQDRQIIVVIWKCPADLGWAVRYRAEGFRQTILAQPSPTPEIP